MSRHDPDVRLRHMLDHAREALALVQGCDRQAFQANRLLQLGVVRLLEIVGEAAARMPPAIVRSHPEVPWAEIVGLRNRLIHGYDAVDLEVVWTILTTDLPTLVDRLERIVGHDSSPS